jgi:hypothetical protein
MRKKYKTKKKSAREKEREIGNLRNHLADGFGGEDVKEDVVYLMAAADAHIERTRRR